MDEAKLRFLFGEVPDPHMVDVEDEDHRIRFFEAANPSEKRPAWAALQSVIAAQVLADTPPEVWQVAQDLMARGIERATVLEQLTLNLTFFTRKILHENTPFDEAAYVIALRRLPIPDPVDVRTAILDAAAAHQGIGFDELVEVVRSGLSREPDDEPTTALVEGAVEILTRYGGPLAVLAGDLVVDIKGLIGGIVLTHRLSEDEAMSGVIRMGCDLAAFDILDDLTLADGRAIVAFVDEEGESAWRSPGGWLEANSAGDLLAVRVSDTGVVSIETVEEPGTDPDLVARLRAAYDAAVGEPPLPVEVEELVLNLLLEDRNAFEAPRPPLADLCAAAGLEVRGDEVAHEPGVWVNGESAAQMGRVLQRLDGEEEALAAFGALEASRNENASAMELRAVLQVLESPDILLVVTDELLGDEESEEALDATDRYAQRLLAAAKRPPEIAVARWLACVVAERRGEPLAGERHIRVALNSAPEWDPAVDRAAWYASDRGDARTAGQLWRGLDPEDTRDLDIVEQYEEAPRRLLRRNDPCWCGSGRKFKNCHLDHPELPPLAERVEWLAWKAASYLERRAGDAPFTVAAYAEAKVSDPYDDEAFVEALDDALVIDCALTEGGWLERFLLERGPLLPPDEAELATAWLETKRTVYEIVDARAGAGSGAGFTLRDIATGASFDAEESIFSERAEIGGHVCGRLVPVGESHQFLGCMFSVPAGREKDILALCEDGRGYELCEAVAELFRQPALTDP